jgi:hypothetical protein
MWGGCRKTLTDTARGWKKHEKKYIEDGFRSHKQGERRMGTKAKKKSFRRTLPGIIVMAAAFLVTAGGIVIAVALRGVENDDQRRFSNPVTSPSPEPVPSPTPTPSPLPRVKPSAGPHSRPHQNPRPLPAAKKQNIVFYFNADLCGPSRMLERCDALEDLKRRITGLKYSLMKSAIDLRIETRSYRSKELLLSEYQKQCDAGRIGNPNRLFMGDYFLVIEKNKAALTGTALLPENLEKSVKGALQ